MITLAVNELIKDIESERVYRLLWIDEGNVIAYVIDINDEKGLPFLLSIKEISQGFIDNTFIKLENVNVDIEILNIELTDKLLMHRDKAWSVIKDLVHDEPAIYKEKERGQYIKKLVDDKICTKMTAYKYLRRYWQKGKTINSLIPEFYKSGGKNKRKHSSDLKMGRPRKDNSVGINIHRRNKRSFPKRDKEILF